MANIFITYADVRYKESLKRLRRQARASGLFDKVVAYTPADLPPAISGSSLMAFPRGGGYWVWKPYLIVRTLAEAAEGDVVYYMDSGCTLRPQSAEWARLQEEIKHHKAIFFQYRDDMKYPGWEKVCTAPANNSSRIRHWMKQSSRDYFTHYFGTDEYLDYCKIWGGFCIVKKQGPLLRTLDEWLRITLFRPDLVADAFGPDLTHEPADYNVHRHDQAIITPLIWRYGREDDILVLPETSESQKDEAAVVASRFIQGPIKSPLLWLKYKFYHLLHPMR